VEVVKPPRPLLMRTAPRGRVVRQLMTRISELEAAQAQARRAQDALRASEERYALAMRGPNEGLWDWDPISKELYLSARLLSILGFASETLRTTSHEWLRLVHPEDCGHYQRTLVAHLKGQTEHFECEYRVSGPDGVYRWVLARGLAVRDRDGLATRMVGSIGDVTERKRREAVLKASEERFRSLIGAAASVVVSIDAAGGIQEFNREAERVCGIARAQAIGTHWRSIFGPGAEDFALLLEAARSGVEMRDHEVAIAGNRILAWNLASFGDNGDVIVIGQDVTRRRNAERALQEANDLLEQRVDERTREAEAAREQAELASRCKSEFVANMSHELRTPLNAIIGFSDTMRLEVMGPVANPRYAEYVTAIWESGSHLLDIINDILDLAKIEAGRFDLHITDSDIRAVLDAAVRLVTERAVRGGITMEVRIGAGIGTALVDPLRLKQVVLNLLSNAVKFTPAGGRITLSAEAERGALVLVVADTGIGMDSDSVAKAMLPFVQVESNLSRRFTGTGLGLPLAKCFVELHGGTIAITSQPGVGTVVTVRMPVNS
jgi:two-component system cell cycle sensor histidine kinase PleC